MLKAVRSESASLFQKDVLAIARSLVPQLKARASATEAARSVIPETIADFHRTGLFKMLQPKRYGGLEVDPKTYFDVLITCAEGCAASAWVLGILALHAWQLAHFPEETQDEFWGEDQSTLASSSYAPTGKVERVEGGYRLSGRWHFSSGCDHATWVLLGGAVKPAPGQKPDTQTFLVPISDYRIDDTWHVMGLCGTGSKDIVIEDAFVPDRRALSYAGLMTFQGQAEKLHGSALYRNPFEMMFFYMISVLSIGVARGALDLYKQRAMKAINVYSGTAVLDEPLVHFRIAQLTSEIDSAHALLHSNMDKVAAVAARGVDYPPEMRPLVRWECVHILNTAARVVDAAFAGSGAHAMMKDNPIQRMFRDVQCMRLHATNNPDRAAVPYGRVALGLDPNG